MATPATTKAVKETPEPSVATPPRFLRHVPPWLLGGLGMFLESYFVFSTGQIKSIWKQLYPLCWHPNSKAACPNLVTCTGGYKSLPATFMPDARSCSSDGSYDGELFCKFETVQLVSYAEFAGIMAGMAMVGFIAVRMGIKWTSVMNTSIMLAGAIMMVSAYSRIINSLFIIFSIGFIVLGFGIGGEYPTAAVGATERNKEDRSSVNGKPNRGRAVQLMFAMQGVGAVTGSLVICILLAIFGQVSPSCPSHNLPSGYNETRLNITWRLVYILPFPLMVWTIFYRLKYTQEPSTRAQRLKLGAQHKSKAFVVMSKTWDAQDVQVEKEIVVTPFLPMLRLFFANYWHRLVGTALGWFLWDVSFYGNKLFSAPIFSAILGPQVELLSQNALILVNNTVALVGYYCAAATIDRRWMGRRRMQVMGFSVSGIFFLLSGLLFNTVSGNTKLGLYLITSFFGQFGPNATTYLLPSESFPLEIRTVAHAISAFTGKAGALVATVLFQDLQVRTIFFVSAGCGLAGMIVTIMFVADLTLCSLEEGERRWGAITQGDAASYHGEAVNYRNLSCWERFVLRLHKNYRSSAVPSAVENGTSPQ